MKNQKEYLPIKLFCNRAKVSDKTVRRLITKIKNEEGLNTYKIQKEKGKIYLHRDLLSLYISDYYLEIEKNRRIEIEQNTHPF